MEQTCLVAVSTDVATYLRVTGPIPELVSGLSVPRARCLPARMLDGAPAAGSRADQDPALADTVEPERFGILSYVAMPVVGPDGTVLGILAGLDRSSLTVPTETLSVLRAIADSLGASDALRDQLVREAPSGVAASNEAEGDGTGSRGTENGAAGETGGAGPTGRAGGAAPPPGTAPGGAAPGGATPSGTAAGGDAAHGAAPPGGTPSGTAGAAGAGGPGEEAASSPRARTAEAPGSERAPRGSQPPSPAGGPGRIPTPDAVARAIRPGPPGRPGAPRPGPPRSGPPRPGTARGPGETGGGAAAGTPAPGASDMRLRRAPTGWIVEGPGAEIRPVGDLISAMVLADLLAEDLSPPGRPRRADRDLNETEQLRLSVIQLEHALASRVIVEQAIGVLAERNHIKPRDAFERLRRTARGMGRRVHDLARQVVESVGDPRVTLPGELGGRGGGPGAAGGPASGSGGGQPRPTPPRAAPSRR
ncbi:ANTAR domain-containing protein [Frankia sp. Mgl5]|uniref:ANTAR domain-containing protein n=1 Tax=Frankia sp. Mgl5 TaxID=2933793 RepID=UPI00200C5B31|nr:ANTAR domain-containing protein [Frankia sp. Mgl5]MCK9926089.1 ANTAR domain-containing protein [Frankia sp. Mgl5]